MDQRIQIAGLSEQLRQRDMVLVALLRRFGPQVITDAELRAAPLEAGIQSVPDVSGGGVLLKVLQRPIVVLESGVATVKGGPG